MLRLFFTLVTYMLQYMFCNIGTIVAIAVVSMTLLLYVTIVFCHSNVAGIIQAAIAYFDREHFQRISKLITQPYRE